eukprot:1159523-Pelagomonas_calceolata.AAC.4
MCSRGAQNTRRKAFEKEQNKAADATAQVMEQLGGLSLGDCWVVGILQAQRQGGPHSVGLKYDIRDNIRWQCRNGWLKLGQHGRATIWDRPGGAPGKSKTVYYVCRPCSASRMLIEAMITWKGFGVLFIV